MKFLAPFPAPTVTMFLPNPSWDDSEALVATVNTMRATDGTVYTYVKDRSSRKVYRWSIQMSKYKALELAAFIKTYYATKVKAVDHNGVAIIGFFKTNPNELRDVARANPWPGGELSEITLEFEECEL